MSEMNQCPIVVSSQWNLELEVGQVDLTIQCLFKYEVIQTLAPEALGIRRPDEPGGLIPELGVAIPDGRLRPLALGFGVDDSTNSSVLPSGTSRT